MKYFRKLITYRKLTAFLAIGMLLRSIVAVGYMLDTNPENGDLFSIIICEGPAAINAISGLDDHAQHHNGHNNNHNNEKPDHATQDHPVSSCSFWSASSFSLLADTSFLNTPDFFLSDEIVVYESHFKLRSTNYTRTARAPPALKII
ncbi:MAG: hypothetical protein HND53_02310 [Proteobacteria bacterium]|nr:hypothetical protein [Pseudomonadota bacterium]NOG59304.1 hypothetical protein [Pseudomonadota bacterium]